MAPSQRKLAAGIALIAASSVALALALRGALRNATEASAEPDGAPSAASSPIGVHASVERDEGSLTQPKDETRRASPSAEEASAEPEGAPSEQAVAGDPSAGLTSRDPFERIRAAEALAQAGRVDALPRLSAMALGPSDRETPAIVKSIGYLATMASPAARDAATARVGKVLLEGARVAESDPGALGGTLAAVDALADTGSAAAIEPLVKALDTERLPLPVCTKIVEALSAVEAIGARGSIERFERRVATLPTTTEPFEQALRDEALAATKEALARLVSR